jgi:3-deoxy-D-manno-octulosonic acid kinase
MPGRTFPVAVPEGYRAEESDRHVLVALSEEWGSVIASGILEGFPQGAEAVPMRGRGTMFRIPLRSGSALARPARHGGLLRSVTGDRFRDPFRPVRELALTAALVREGVPAPEPVAAAAIRRGPFFRLYYVSREMVGQDLYAFLSGPAVSEARASALRRAGAVIRGLHEHGVLHTDLHPKNLFVAEGSGEVLVLDLDRTARGPAPTHEERIGNLVRFYRFGRRQEDLGEGRAWSEDELRTLLEGYAGADAGDLAAEILRSYQRSSWLHRIGWRLERTLARRRAAGVDTPADPR